ncbi:MAG TPA: transposase [candidate division Zixibacteria bacterium]|nr:transposase [candidate division Zixibacteria bacterium]
MYKNKRQSFDIPGHAHFLTFSCFRRCQIFSNELACILLAESLKLARQKLEFDLWSYVFMPDHIHLLIHPRNEKYSTSQILKEIKGPFAKKLLKVWRESNENILKDLAVESSGRAEYRVWERGGGFDKNLYSVDKIRAAIAYIEENPVRKGLVSNVKDWKWSSARAHLNENACLLDIDRIVA